MKYLLPILLFATSHLYGLDAEAIREIAGKPHSRENLIEELKVYPDAREYKIKMRSGKTAKEMEAAPEQLAQEKTVEGRYLVSTVALPNELGDLIMVVNYDKNTDTFRKWVLLPNGAVGASTGVADFKTRTIAWASDLLPGGPRSRTLSIESHSDEGSTWKETIFQDGKVVTVMQGEAVKTK